MYDLSFPEPEVDEFDTAEHQPPQEWLTGLFLLAALIAAAAAGVSGTRRDVFGNSLLNQPTCFWLTSLLLVASLIFVVVALSFAWLRRRFATAVEQHDGPGPSVGRVLTVAAALMILLGGLAGYGAYKRLMPVAVPLWNPDAGFTWDSERSNDPAFSFSLRAAASDPADGYDEFTLGSDPIYVDRDAVVTAEHLQLVHGAFSPPGSSTAVVSLAVDEAGREALFRWTSANVGKRLAIVLNGEVQSAPNVRGTIASEMQIHGDWTVEQVQELVASIREFNAE